MSTKVYPGIRYRILRPTEILREGDEYHQPGVKYWHKTRCVGQPCGSGLVTRRLKDRYRKVPQRR